jgi:esterase/lipase
MKMWVTIGIYFFVGLIFPNQIHARPFKDCTNLKNHCFDLDNNPSGSFFIKSPGSQKAAVLVHGLSDSAYFNKDIALLLHSQGYNVYSVLLSGHGTQVEDLIPIRSKDWIQDVAETILQAKRETGADKILLEGFSMGGALVTYFAENPVWKYTVSKLILIAPAFQVKSNSARVFCATGAYHFKTWAWNHPGYSPVKYSKMYLKSACELVDLGAMVSDESEKVSVPAFMALTDSDQTINNGAALETFKNMKSTSKSFYYVKNQNVAHAAITFQTNPIGNVINPSFDEMAKEILKFIKR